jgi:hypothetical protein
MRTGPAWWFEHDAGAAVVLADAATRRPVEDAVAAARRHATEPDAGLALRRDDEAVDAVV